MTKQIPLTQGKFALVDDEDYEYLSQWKWCVFRTTRSIYAARGTFTNGKIGKVYMHRAVVEHANGEKPPQVDHINCNGLDNRRSNLRGCTSTENHRNARRRKDNSTGFKGVHWDKERSKYRAQIRVNKKNLFLGRFSSPDAAAHAYDKAARKHFGKFARTNF